MEPGERYRKVIEPTWEREHSPAVPLHCGAWLRSLRPEQRHLYTVHWCQAQVCNGGFHQFLANPSGILAPEAAEGFRAIGLPGCAALVDEAVAFFGTPFLRS